MGKKGEKNTNNGLYFILGVILIIYSIANFFALLRGTTYPFLITFSVTELMLIALSVMLFQRTFKLKHQARSTSFMVALGLFFFGALPIAIQLGLSYYLPFTIELAPSFIVTNLILFFGAIYFVIDQYLVLYKNEYS
jgi:hypothetical protein